ncbi:hypothetical protein EWM64_g8954 [Hericium alpestre]|uniref:Uncharacterized protein n=1 Tax=Hericium alpestre TaxID=135208 RepID=A0A4Y9ZNQ3_9AGAM|nr:hypothetical protein EWM64_g8954 [Hericium alpestre]
MPQAFDKHISAFHSSGDFKEKELHSGKFFTEAKDFVFGRPATLVNAMNTFDFMNHELTHTSYAHRLPPTFIEQGRHWANYHEDGVFSDKDMGGTGNIARRTLLRSIISSLQARRLRWRSLATEMIEDDESLRGISDYASAIAIEPRRGSLPDNRDFLRFKFKNSTTEEEFRTLPCTCSTTRATSR